MFLKGTQLVDSGAIIQTQLWLQSSWFYLLYHFTLETFSVISSQDF